MHCQNCGTVLPDGTGACPTCGVKFAAPQQPAAPAPLAQQPPYAVPASPAPAAPAPKKKRTGLIIGVVIAILVLAGAGAALVLLVLMPAKRTVTATSPAYAPVYPNVSAATTTAPDVSDSAAAENAVTTFYDTINAGDFAKLPSLVTADTKSAVGKGAFKSWSTTTVQIARSVVDNDVAEVFALESRQEFGSKDRGVKFTLQHVGGAWLVNTWAAVDAAALKGDETTSGAGLGAETLSDTTARDIVSSLLQARQTGDAATIRVLTTAKFQQDNAAAWLDGVDNSPYFTAFSIKTSKVKGATYVLTVLEQWNSGAETATYTVVEQDGKILVDSWTSK